MKKITVIIPFLNENIEIKNTLESIRQYAQDKVDILLINDNSEDDFNYVDIAKQYDARYIKNSKRLGVAASRDLGIDTCRTPYFLLLDGHMRFYKEGWEKIISDELDKDDRVILCCQTKVLASENGVVYEKTGNKSSVSGAYINFDEDRKILEATWRYTKTDNLIEPIPCILGAAYAGSKRYWKHLKGLYGLQSYGYDEAYLSLKVWLEGGRCLLLNQIIVGHIYRKSMPYTVEPVHMVYNKLLITELLLQGHQKTRLLYLLKQKNTFSQAYALFSEKQKEWEKLKNYYAKIFTRDFKEVKRMQADVAIGSDTQKEKDHLLKRIATHLILQSSTLDDMGLLTGKMGIVLFFFHYARYCQEKKYEEFGGELLDEIYQDIYEGMSITFNKGLCGIGWGIEYLIQNGFVEGCADDILSDIDEKIMAIDPLYINDFSLQTGLEGIFHYINSRLISPRDQESNLPFTPSYLEHLAEHAYMILNNGKTYTCRALAARFLTIYQHTASKPELPGIYEVVSPWVPSGNNLSQWPLGLENGCAGKALKIILE